MAEEKKFRVESDLLGELKVPAGALYGIQTQRGINNYHISRKTMCSYPDFIIAIAYVKLAAIETNHTLGVINDEISGAISQACREIIEGKWHENFPIDMCNWVRPILITSSLKIRELPYRHGTGWCWYICQHERQRGNR